MSANASDTCLICDESMGFYKNDLNDTTGFSQKPIFQHFETYMEIKLPSSIIDTGGVCQNCYIKFNEIDEHQLCINKIQKELLELFNETQEKSGDRKIQVTAVPRKKATAVSWSSVTKAENNANKINMNETVVSDFWEIPVKAEKVQDSENETDCGAMDDYGNDDYFSDNEPFAQNDFEKKIKEKQTEKYAENENKSQNEKKEASGGDQFYNGRLGGSFGKPLVVEKKIYKCNVCGRICQDSNKLRKHKASHSDERTKACLVCGAMFKTQNCLYAHMKVHKERPTLICDICGSKYVEKSHLKRHVDAVHLKKRDYKCDICGKCFSRTGTLSKHKMIHSDEKNVICSICGYRTHEKSKLKRHMATHTRERNYCCEICGKGFRYSYNVLVHVRNVHNIDKPLKQRHSEVNESRLTCQICFKHFSKPSNTKSHMIKVHKIDFGVLNRAAV